MKKTGFILLLFLGINGHATKFKSFSKQPVITNDTTFLNILVSSSGYVYYYTEPLAEDASNFKMIIPRNIIDVIRMEQREARQEGDSLIVVFKVQESKKAGDIARWYHEYRRGKLNDTEKKLIELTEESNGKKN